MVSTTRSALEAQAHLRGDAPYPVVDDVEIDHRLLEHGQVVAGLDQGADGVPVEHAIRLRPGRANGGTLAGVQRAQLDARPIRGQRHRTAQGVDFAYQVGLADASDRRIARHLADGLDALRQQQGPCPDPRRGKRRFGAGMAAANDDHVVLLWVVHGGQCAAAVSGWP